MNRYFVSSSPETSRFEITSGRLVESDFLGITSLTSLGGEVWELTLQGLPETIYQFRVASDLDFSRGTVVGGLTQGNLSDAGTIGGDEDTEITTDADGIGVIRMSLTGRAQFVRAELVPSS